MNDPKHPFRITPIGHDPINRTGRQWDISEPILKENGAIYILQTSRYLQSRIQRPLPWTPYVMSEEDSLDIDEEKDMEAAQTIMEKCK